MQTRGLRQVPVQTRGLCQVPVQTRGLRQVPVQTRGLRLHLPSAQPSRRRLCWSEEQHICVPTSSSLVWRQPVVPSAVLRRNPSV